MVQDVIRFRSEGYRIFQLKVGGDPDDDIERIKSALSVISPGDVLVADANRGWLAAEAMRVVNALAGENCYVEQPCQTLEECLVIRNHTNLPMVLDEVITGANAFLMAWQRNAMDIINLKVSKRTGRVIGAKQVRPEDGLMLITKEGKIIRINVEGVRLSGRSTQGVKLMDLEPEDRLVAVAKLAEQEESEIEEAISEEQAEQGSAEPVN